MPIALCVMAGIASGNVELIWFAITSPMMPAYKKRKQPPRAEAMPACCSKGNMEPPLPAPSANVPPMPISTMGKTKLYSVNPVIKYHASMIAAPNKVMP